MQILESTASGLRSARITLRRPNLPVEVTLFPMIHVAETGFFSAVYEDALSHDVVLIEGVDGPIAKRITRSYSWLVGSRRLGLALQPRPEATGSTVVVAADLSAEEFAVEWRKVPLWIRTLAYVVPPLLGLTRRWFVSREALAAGLSMDDLTPDEDLWDSPETAALHHALLQARDERLLDRLDAEMHHEADGVRRIAVVYGAAHMRAVVKGLTARGFHPAGSRWLTVFSL